MSQDNGGSNAAFTKMRAAAFGAYAVVLFTLTHWPRLELPNVVERPDLFVHFAAFGLWAFC